MDPFRFRPLEAMSTRFRRTGTAPAAVFFTDGTEGAELYAARKILFANAPPKTVAAGTPADR